MLVEWVGDPSPANHLVAVGRYFGDLRKSKMFILWAVKAGAYAERPEAP